ncbi:MAG: DegV family protein [Candidatus Heimdallarchaeota archaeon]|nr:DegV family protein [Candidatus Heimdallarchaeota archaeon]
MTVKIMTDSAADIPQKYLEKYDIRTVPTVIRFGDEIFYENVDINLEQFYEKFYNSETYPQTANPTLHHQFSLYEELGKQSEEVLNIVISSGISGSYNTAQIAYRNYKRKIENPSEIHIYDSKFATFGIGILAIRAAEMAIKGCSVKEILSMLDDYQSSLQIGFTVENLKYLHRGGRLSLSKYWVAKIADMKPVINFIDGKMEVIKTVRGHETAVIESFNSAYDKMGRPSKFNAYIMHARNEESAQLIKAHIENQIQPEDWNISIREVGMAIATHAGPGCIGICLDTKYKFLR